MTTIYFAVLTLCFLTIYLVAWLRYHRLHRTRDLITGYVGPVFIIAYDFFAPRFVHLTLLYVVTSLGFFGITAIAVARGELTKQTS